MSWASARTPRCSSRVFRCRGRWCPVRADWRRGTGWGRRARGTGRGKCACRGRRAERAGWARWARCAGRTRRAELWGSDASLDPAGSDAGRWHYGRSRPAADRAAGRSAGRSASRAPRQGRHRRDAHPQQPGTTQQELARRCERLVSPVGASGGVGRRSWVGQRVPSRHESVALSPSRRVGRGMSQVTAASPRSRREFPLRRGQRRAAASGTPASRLAARTAAACTKARNNRRNAGGVELSRSGWHCTPIRKRSGSVVSRASTSMPPSVRRSRLTAVRARGPLGDTPWW